MSDESKSPEAKANASTAARVVQACLLRKHKRRRMFMLFQLLGKRRLTHAVLDEPRPRLARPPTLLWPLVAALAETGGVRVSPHRFRGPQGQLNSR